MNGSVGSVVESIRFTRQVIPHDELALGSCEHDWWFYTIWWTDPDGAENSTSAHKCWHPICDESPWVFSTNLRDHTEIVKVAWIRDNARNAIAVAYVLRVLRVSGDHCRPEVVARIGIPDQWEDRSLGNHHGELHSRRYYAEQGRGVYPAIFTETL